MLIENMGRVSRRPSRGARGGRRILVPYCADDDERVNLNSIAVRFIDQILKRVEARSERHEVRWRFERVEIPRVPTPPHLHEDRVRIDRLGVFDYADDIPMVVQRGIKAVNPESPVLADGLRRRAIHNQRQPDQQPERKTGWPKSMSAI